MVGEYAHPTAPLSEYPMTTIDRISRNKFRAARLACTALLALGLSVASALGDADQPDATVTSDPSLPASWIPVPGFTAKTKVPHGQIREVMYDNTLLGKIGADGRKVSVYTPPGYDPTQKYPVLYALHGIGGNHKEWLSAKPQQILDNLYAAKKIVPMIVVFPNGRAMNPDTCPKDMYGSANVQGFYDFWDKDMRDFLIPFIEKTYSVQADKEHRAIMGYSMGGMQAVRFGLGNPTYFGYIGGLAPAFRPDVKTLTADDINSQYKRFFLSAGTLDSLFKPTETFSEALTAKGVHHIFVPVEGAKHDGSTWSPGLYNFAQIIFK